MEEKLRENLEDYLLEQVNKSDVSNLEKGFAEEILYRYFILKDEGVVNFELDYEKLKNMASNLMEYDFFWEDVNRVIDDEIIDSEQLLFSEYKKYCFNEYLNTYDKAEDEFFYNNDEKQKFEKWYEEKLFESFKLLLECCGCELKINNDNTFSLIDIIVESDIENEKFNTLTEIIERLDKEETYIKNSILDNIYLGLNSLNSENVKTKSLIEDIERDIKDADYNKIADDVLKIIEIEKSLMYLEIDAEMLKLVYSGADIQEFKDYEMAKKHLYDVCVIEKNIDNKEIEEMEE